MLGKVQLGVTAMLCSSLICTFQIIFGKLVTDSEWPYFTIMVVANILMALTFGTISVVTGARVPQPSQHKWVAMLAVSGTFSFLSSIVAVQVSAAPGDVAALTSINIVFAAFMGHLFLAEKLRLVHVAIVSCSVAGAVLISKPAFIFGGKAGSWLGCALALFSGFARAASLVCARKSVGVPVSLLSFATAVLGLPIIALLPFTPLIAEPPVGRVLVEPLAAAGLVLAAFFAGLAAISAGTLGSLLCPAAVSATVFTGACMVVGYLAQTLLFGAAPGWLTLVGAALMFFAVAATAGARTPQQLPSAEALPTTPSVDQRTPQQTPVAEAVDVGADSVAGAGGVTGTEDDETESLASFAASEFSEQAPHETPLRRRGQAIGKPFPERIGTAGMAAVVATAAV